MGGGRATRSAHRRSYPNYMRGLYWRSSSSPERGRSTLSKCQCAGEHCRSERRYPRPRGSFRRLGERHFPEIARFEHWLQRGVGADIEERTGEHAECPDHGVATPLADCRERGARAVTQEREPGSEQNCARDDTAESQGLYLQPRIAGSRQCVYADRANRDSGAHRPQNAPLAQQQLVEDHLVFADLTLLQQRTEYGARAETERELER